MANEEEEIIGGYQGEDTDDPVQDDPTPDEPVNDEYEQVQPANNNQNSNVKFLTNILYENEDGSVSGMEILIYNDAGVNIEKILLVDETDFNSWTELVSKLSDAYVYYSDVDAENLSLLKDKREQYEKQLITWTEYQSFLDDLEWSNLKKLGSLENILKNPVNEETNDYSVEINATLFNDMNSDEFSKIGHKHNYANIYHSSRDTSYGVGDNELFGHCKVIDNLNSNSFVAGETLSAYQGKVLNDGIQNLKKKNAWSKAVNKNSYLNYEVNSDLRLVVCNYKRDNYTELSKSTGNHILHGANTIPKAYQPKRRVMSSLYRGDVVLWYGVDGSVNVYNLTKLQKIHINAQVMWHY